jgi:hypothetical protein
MWGVVGHNKRPTFPPGTPPQFSELAGRCWLRSPGDRPAMAEVVVSLRELRAQQRAHLAQAAPPPAAGTHDPARMH